MPIRQFDFIAAGLLIALCSATVWAEDTPQVEPNRVAAVATDVSPATSTPEDVAREVVRLQEEMGGSIAAGFGTLGPQKTASPPPVPVPLPYVPLANPHSYLGSRQSAVQSLREIVWQLELSAHLLESLDLYDQADALRSTADRLRLDARALKTGPPSAKASQSDVTSRQD
jgi:hypothetical protein